MLWSIYKIVHKFGDGSEKLYVGLTNRKVEKRFTAHLNDMSREKAVTKGSLGEALRLEYGKDPQTTAFSIHLLEKCATVEEVQAAEAKWIEALNTMTPSGYNLMPGGASVGGPSNSRPLEILIDGKCEQFPSLSSLVRKLADERDEDFDRLYARTTMRVASGWSMEQALDLAPKEDGRTTNLAIQARESGVNLDTLRSRRQRQKERATQPPICEYLLPHPDDPEASPVSAYKFGSKLNIPVSTVRRRARQIYSKMSGMSRDEIITHLTQKQDRAHRLTIWFEDGSNFSGTKNELASFFAKGTHPKGRYLRDTLRARLRKLCDAPDNEAILVALGLRESSSKKPHRIKVPAVHLRKSNCDDWIVTWGEKSHDFGKQVHFVDKCWIQMQKLGKVHRSINTKPGTNEEFRARLQRWVSAETGNKRTPTELAIELGVLEGLFS